MSGVKCLLGCFHYRVHRQISDNDIYLDFRKKGRIHFNTTVILSGAFLDTTAHNLCNRHSGNTEVI